MCGNDTSAGGVLLHVVFSFSDNVVDIFPAIDRRQKVLYKLFSVRKRLRWKRLLEMPMTMGAYMVEVTVFASTQLCSHVRKWCGCIKDEKDIRGRRKS